MSASASTKTQLGSDRGTGDAEAPDAYKQALKLLDRSFVPKATKICLRAQFKQRWQQADKTAEQFILDTDRLAQQWGFGTGVEAMIQDQVISDIA